MVFNDMLFEKSTNVNNNTTEQIDKNTNTNSQETKSEHNSKLTTSTSISYTNSSAINYTESNNSYNKRKLGCDGGGGSFIANLTNNEILKNLPNQQPSVGSGYFGLGIPKSPSFHSGLDQLADDYDDDVYDNDKISLKATEHIQSNINISSGGVSGGVNNSIGSKFKFTNIEEIKAKLSNSSFSTIRAVKKVYNNKMPGLQPQSQEINYSSTTTNNQSHPSNSSVTSSSSSSSSQQQVTSVSNNSVSLNAPTSSHSNIMATSSSNTGGQGSSSTTNPISSTTSSIVSTLAQHFNAATSATQLLTTASSTLGSNNKV